MSYISKIQDTVEDKVSIIADATQKIGHLVLKLRENDKPYSIAPSAEKLDYFGKAICQRPMPYDDEVFSSCLNWFCSYKSIMTQLSIIDDYMDKVRAAMKELDEPLFDQDWEGGKSRIDVIRDVIDQEKQAKTA